LQSLEKSRTRKQLQLAPVEGAKEIEMAILAGMEFHSVFFARDLANEGLLKELSDSSADTEFIELEMNLFSKISYRETTGGMIGIVKTVTRTLDSIRLPAKPLILIVEAVEKPGNLGAMLRTADAAAIDAVICCDISTDIFNPNIIRSSLGTIFTVPLFVEKSEHVMTWLKKNSIATYCTNLHKATDYHEEDFTGPCAIIVGTEATGVSEQWIDFSDRNVKIPMLGKIDSMNVSVAAAIMLYEAKRQRGFERPNG
jgi:TrmH family RNA methyltransferase